MTVLKEYIKYVSVWIGFTILILACIFSLIFPLFFVFEEDTGFGTQKFHLGWLLFEFPWAAFVIGTIVFINNKFDPED